MPKLVGHTVPLPHPCAEPLVASFDTPQLSSDAGAILLKAVDERLAGGGAPDGLDRGRPVPWRRMKALVSATRKMSDSELSARTRLPHGPAEPAQLAGAFDGLAPALQARQAEAGRAEEELRRTHDG
jgi:hypothetical protein